MAITKPSVRLIKEFTYRGATRAWSNRYYFDGGVPADTAAWDALFDALVLEEKAVLGDATTIVAAHGYEAPSDVAVASKSYSVTGLITVSGKTPGDCAAVLRQATTKRSTKNHPVYCFSYYHDARFSAPNPDTLAGAQVTAIENFGNAFVAGITVGGATYKRCTPDGHLTTGAHCEPWVGHRDFVN